MAGGLGAIQGYEFSSTPSKAKPAPSVTSLNIGSAAVDGLNEALLAKAAEAKLLRTNRIRADTTVVWANVAYPTDSGLLARAIGRIAATRQAGPSRRRRDPH